MESDRVSLTKIIFNPEWGLKMKTKFTLKVINLALLPHCELLVNSQQWGEPIRFVEFQ